MAKYTLITGASEGIGVELARQAAKDKRALILTARSEDKLNALADELRPSVSDIVVIPADLSKLEDAERLWTEATKDREIDVLVNNAGLGAHDRFDADTWERELASINVNLLALTRLMKLAIPHMQARGSGRILNVASTAAFMPGPNMAVYHATKAYVLSLSEAVAEELRGTGITITALCPGATETAFFDAADMRDVRLLKLGSVAKASDVAELGWLQTRAGKRIVVPGAINKVFAFLTRLLPRSMVTRVASTVMGKN